LVLTISIKNIIHIIFFKTKLRTFVITLIVSSWLRMIVFNFVSSECRILLSPISNLSNVIYRWNTQPPLFLMLILHKTYFVFWFEWIYLHSTGFKLPRISLEIVFNDEILGKICLEIL
jgi:hypothetical protein